MALSTSAASTAPAASTTTLTAAAAPTTTAVAFAATIAVLVACAWVAVAGGELDLELVQLIPLLFSALVVGNGQQFLQPATG